MAEKNDTMTLTAEMQTAMDIVSNTNDNLFVTGKAGSGKTTFLKYLIANCGKKCIITAPTGVAAINAGGVTLHSMFGIPFGPIAPHENIKHRYSEQKTELLLQLQVLIIDEISMVRPDILDVINRKLQWVRESDKPFGGVQVVMFGDMFQLPPVVKAEDAKILSCYYNDYYFFNALVFKRSGFRVVELTKVFRQTNTEFVDVLNKIRNYEVTPDELDLLGELKDKKTSSNYDGNYIHICTHKADVESINKEKLGTEGVREYNAVLEGDFPVTSIPCNMTLSLRVGARIMSLINDSSKGCYNGMLGNVVAMEEKFVMAKMDNGMFIKFDYHKWTNTRYTLDGENIVKEDIGSCSQIPLTLAWAITIHKSQGLTFDRVAIHVGNTFCPGQLYVALSRCRTLEGIVSDAYITQKMIIPDYALIDFERAYKSNNNFYGKKR